MLFVGFSLHPEQFSWQLWPEMFIGLPDRGLVFTEPLIFHLLITVWTLLTGIINSLDIFLYPFPVLYSSTTFSHRSVDNSFAFPMTHNPKTSVAGWKMQESVWIPETHSHAFMHTHWLQANRSQVRMLPLVAIQTHLCQLLCMLSGQNHQGMWTFDQGHLDVFGCHYDLKRENTVIWQ